MPLLFSSVESAARPQINLRWDGNALISDNPFLLPGNDRASAAVELVARPELYWLVSPRTSVEAEATVAFRQYLARYGNFGTGRVRGGMRHRSNDFLSTSAFLSYARELPTDGLTSSIDAAIDPRHVRESISAQTTVEWTPNSRSEITGDAWADRISVPESELLWTTRVYGLRARAMRRVTSLLSIGAEGEITTADIGPGEPATTQAIRFTLAKRLSEEWRAEAQIGVERADPGGWAGAADDARLNGRAQVCHEPQYTSFCVAAALRSGVSGLAGLQRETFVNATFTRRLDERRNISARAEYLHARLQPMDAVTEFMRATASFEQRLSENAWLLSSLSYLRRKPPLGESVGGAFFQIGISFRRERR